MKKCIRCNENEIDDNVFSMCVNCINTLCEKGYLYQKIKYEVNPEILFPGLSIYFDKKYMIVRNIRANIINCIYVDENGKDTTYYVDVFNIDKIKIVGV